MNKRFAIYLPIFFALTLIAGILAGRYLLPGAKNSSTLFNFNRYDKFNDVMNFIESDYVDTINKKTLLEKAVTGMLESLDPHSVYIPAEDFNEANDPLAGNFDGIGIQFRKVRDTIVVINTIPGGPSEKQGLLAGDRIVKIDGKNVAGIKIPDEEVMKRLKGPRGTTVKVGIYRRDEHKMLNFTITRNVIPTYSVDIAYMVDSRIGYIKLSKFSASTADEVYNAISSLKNQGMTQLIFDLRGNGGGYLDAAISIADEFLPENKMIVYTEGSHRPRQNHYSKNSGLFENNDLAILIDEFSASASEILAGAIQDNDRGTIIGRRSFGKGLVQEQIQLDDGSAIRLTVARYHTPTGRCIQKPYTSDIDKYYTEFYKSLLDEYVETADSLNFADTAERYKTPKGKIVYGGGGIMPDIYIPYKSENVSAYYRKIVSKGLVYDYAFDYADKNRKSLKRYNNAKNFLSQFQVSNELFNDFITYAEQKGVVRDEVGIKLAGPGLKAMLKGYIGRNIFDDPAFYPVILTEDITFKKAIEVLKLK
ncbi:MAG TPA: S41 family peptidase [Bacteroidales bacterium]|nr:S41 family peptidase [Bacteroidales bacterium]